MCADITDNLRKENFGFPLYVIRYGHLESQYLPLGIWVFGFRPVLGFQKYSYGVKHDF